MTRRQMIERSMLTAAAFTTPGLLADRITTPQLTEGPYYPDKMPLDTDNDLLILNDSLTPAVGEITHLSGHVFSKSGEPVRNAFVEIWQTDNTGKYLHSNDTKNRDRRDKNFQGYGRFLTGSDGSYYFRTIKPVAYSTGGIYRTPHIHFAISLGGKRIFTGQMLINGHPDNADDFLFRRIKDPIARETLLADFKPVPNSKFGELSANFDIQLGRTVEELDDGTIRGLGKPLGGGLNPPA